MLLQTWLKIKGLLTGIPPNSTMNLVCSWQTELHLLSKEKTYFINLSIFFHLSNQGRVGMKHLTQLTWGERGVHPGLSQC